MRRSVAALIALSLAVSATPVFAATASPMAACAAQWQTMKKEGKDKGTTYKEFSKTCMSKSADGSTTTTSVNSTSATAPATPAKKPSILSAMMAKKPTTTTTTTTTAAAPPAAAPAPAPAAATKTTKTKTTTTTKSKSAKAEDSDPTGATANCKDGTYSHSKTHSGSCAGHGGVAKFLS